MNMDMHADPARFITIPLSHYCEKARWGLDRVALPYREEPHAPLLNRLAGGTVPALVHEGKRFIDSTDILVHADSVRGGDLLYPRDAELRREVDSLEERFDIELGPHTRRWAYAQFVASHEVASLGVVAPCATTRGEPGAGDRADGAYLARTRRTESRRRPVSAHSSVCEESFRKWTSCCVTAAGFWLTNDLLPRT